MLLDVVGVIIMNVNKNNYRNRNQTSRFNAQVCHWEGLCKDSEDNETKCERKKTRGGKDKERREGREGRERGFK